MRVIARATAALAGAALVALALAGCGPTTDDVKRDLAVVVLDADPNIVDIDISVGQDLTGPGVRLRIYLHDTSDEAVIAALDAAMEAAWTGSPARPTGIYLDAAAAPRPRSELVRGTAIRIRPLEDRIGLPGSIINDVIGAGRDELEEFYGPRDGE